MGQHLGNFFHFSSVYSCRETSRNLLLHVLRVFLTLVIVEIALSLVLVATSLILISLATSSTSPTHLVEILCLLLTFAVFRRISVLLILRLLRIILIILLLLLVHLWRPLFSKVYLLCIFIIEVLISSFRGVVIWLS